MISLHPLSAPVTGSSGVKHGMAEMLKGGLIMDVVTPEQARIAEDTVTASFANTPDERLKQLMQALVKHLHAFIRVVRLTETEWNRAIEFPRQCRAHHRRQAPGIHPALRRPRRVHADHQREQPGRRQRHRGHRLRALLHRRRPGSPGNT